MCNTYPNNKSIAVHQDDYKMFIDMNMYFFILGVCILHL